MHLESRKELKQVLDDMFKACGMEIVAKGRMYKAEIQNGFEGFVRVNYSGVGAGAAVGLSYGLQHPDIMKLSRQCATWWPDVEVGYSISHLALALKSNNGMSLFDVEYRNLAQAGQALERIQEDYLSRGRPWMERHASWPFFLELTNDPGNPLAVWSHPVALVLTGSKEQALIWARSTRLYAADPEYREFVLQLESRG